MKDDQGIYIGMLGEQAAMYWGERHAAIFGPNGSGKDTKLVTPNTLQWKGSCLILDPKAECAVQTAKWRGTFSDVYVINPMGVLLDKYPDVLVSCGFNPLLGIDPSSDTFVEECTEIAEALVVRTPDSRDPHWDASAAELVRMLVMSEATLPEPSLAHVRDLLCLPYEAVDSEEESAGGALGRIVDQLEKKAGGNGKA